MPVSRRDSVKPWRIYVHARGTDDESIAVRRVAQDWKPVDVVSVADLVAWLDAGGIEKLYGLGPRPRRVAELIAREFDAR